MSGRQSPLVVDAQRVKLTEGLRAPARARAWIAEQIGDVPAQLLDDALLIASELVTNAVRYGRPEVVLGLLPLDDGIRIEVSDSGETMPRMSAEPPSQDRLGGRGLVIVASTAADWGVAPHDPPPGKTVWVQLVVPR
ncbi:ATP-binding protein [Jatrophihabitans sp.]|uniref:ATP-binding protein n=1 Tax=Jatrophihabitans sp. TaxID=1932789 RepID=UPI0030C6CDF7|nr:6-phosphofructokinase [Jatrophihabitans sp.]